LLRPARNDPLLSQVCIDTQPSPQIVNNDMEYEVEHIVDKKLVQGRRKLLVKWTGFVCPTWEPKDAFKDTAALAI
jgi:hypothetical protein